MAEVYREGLGNPHTLHHEAGRRAAVLLDQARERFARTVGAEPDDVVFTSGATESNTLAIAGAGPVVTCRTEHVSVLRPCERLARVDYIPPDRWGHLDPADVDAAF